MELIHSLAATSIRTRRDDLAFSALPDAPVQPITARPARSRRPARARSRDQGAFALVSMLSRLTKRRPTAECTNVHSTA
ncbi:MAG TPA: hypothetical protein VH761_06100 [Ilumatobacteraceae bacterium]|jgi:hypothetical protein